MPKPANGQSHIPALDGVRGLAIILVLIFHTSLSFHATGGIRWHFLQLAMTGWVGVDLFFVLSGFLITRILVRSKSKLFYFRKFYARRSLRIFPLYYFVLIVFLIVAMVGFRLGSLQFEPGKFWRAQTFLFSYTSNIAYAFADNVDIASVPIFSVSHFWSLAVEEQFYLAWPLIIYLVPERKLPALCLSVIAGALLLRAGLYFHGSPHLMLYMFTPCRIDALAAGSLIAVVLERESVDIARLRVIAWAVMVLSFIGMASFYLHYRCYLNYARNVDAFGLTFNVGFFAGLLALVVITPTTSRLSRYFSWAWLRAVGRYSYGLYVYHFPILAVLLRVLPAEWVPTRSESTLGGNVLFVLAYIATTFLVSILSYHLMETRFIALKDRLHFGAHRTGQLALTQ